jgi:hypothetical protein
MTEIDAGRWYWDRRSEKALYARRLDDDTVEFVTVWHAEEVEDALEGGVLVPVGDIDVDHSETAFDLVDSFRMPERVEGGSDEGAVSPDDE